MSAWDPLTDDEMAELIEYPMLVHLHDAHRLVAALATIATLRDALDRHHAFLLNGVQECGLCKRAGPRRREGEGVSRHFWYLVGHDPIATDDIRVWAAATDGERPRVAKDEIGEVYISTVFLGVDHQFSYGPPLLFETMAFRGAMDERQWRYATWDEAEAGHRRVVEAIRLGTVLDD